MSTKSGLVQAYSSELGLIPKSFHTPCDVRATITHQHANYRGRLDFIQNLLYERFHLQVIRLHVFLSVIGSCPDCSQVQQLCLPHQPAFAYFPRPQR